ncbi:MAG: hypothetical protein QM669_05215 [Siphonobacter sp.]
MRHKQANRILQELAYVATLQNFGPTDVPDLHFVPVPSYNLPVFSNKLNY